MLQKLSQIVALPDGRRDCINESVDLGTSEGQVLVSIDKFWRSVFDVTNEIRCIYRAEVP
jgi:hypothetical protein